MAITGAQEENRGCGEGSQPRGAARAVQRGSLDVCPSRGSTHWCRLAQAWQRNTTLMASQLTSSLMIEVCDPAQMG